MEQGTLPENAPRRRKLVLDSWVCNKRNGVVEVRTFSFIFRCWVETCNAKARDCNHLRMNKVSIVGTDMDFMSCYSMKKNFGHYEDMRIWSMEDLCILRVVVPCKNHWPLEKIRILHWVDFRKNEYEFCLDMCDAPRVCGMKWRPSVVWTKCDQGVRREC